MRLDPCQKTGDAVLRTAATCAFGVLVPGAVLFSLLEGASFIERQILQLPEPPQSTRRPNERRSFFHEKNPRVLNVPHLFPYLAAVRSHAKRRT